MREAEKLKDQTINIGKSAENKASYQDFNLKCIFWKDGFDKDAGIVTLIHKRNGDEQGYPITLQMLDDGNIGRWIIETADLEKVGYGDAELVYRSEDVVAKSDKFKTYVKHSITSGTVVPPAYEHWVNDILLAGLTAEQAKQLWLNMSAIAIQLPEGSAPTASYSEGVLTLGIPKGDRGLRGFGIDTNRTYYDGETHILHIVYEDNRSTTIDEFSQLWADMQEALSEGEGIVARTEALAEETEGYKNEAEGFKNDAQTSAQTATEKAQDAQGYANSAELAKEGAEGFAEDAGTFASEAEGYKNLAETAKTDAQTAKTQAEQAKTDAEGFAEDAEDAKDLAEGFKNDARGYSQSAEGFATDAETSATNANTAKTDAQSAKTDAESARDLAQGYKNDAEDSAEDAESARQDIQDSINGVAQEDTAQDMLEVLGEIDANVKEIVGKQMPTWVDTLPMEGEEGKTYITYDGVYHYENGEYTQVSGGDLNGFTFNLGLAQEVILGYINPDDSTDIRSATFPTESTADDIVDSLNNIAEYLEIIAKGGLQ